MEKEGGMDMDYRIREIRKAEYCCLEEFLYEAVFVPEGVEPPPKSIITLPELRIYTEGFGQEPHDRGLVAEENGKIVGAVWTRIMEDYGHIDEKTPSLAMSLYPAYRGKGIGTALLREMLALLAKDGYVRVSLSVQRANAAVRLYQTAGFCVWEEKEEELIMVKDLKSGGFHA